MLLLATKEIANLAPIPRLSHSVGYIDDGDEWAAATAPLRQELFLCSLQNLVAIATERNPVANFIAQVGIDAGGDNVMRRQVFTRRAELTGAVVS